MNTPIPPSSQDPLHQQKAGGPSSVVAAIVTVVAIHVVFFGGLLMQGCKRDNGSVTSTATPTNRTALTLPPIDTNTNYVSASTNLPAPENPTPTPPIVAAPEPVVTNAPVVSTESKEYTVLKGDSLYKIAKANGVTIGAITKANPKLDASRLKAGQKIMIPASSKAGSADGAEMAGSSNSGGTHVVKAGETLTKIAKQHATTVKALRAANGLKTDRLNIGQKLKLPAGGTAANAAATTTAATNTP